MNEKQERIEKIYSRARLMGLCRTKKEFAALVGLNASSISSALNGREEYLSDKMMRTIEMWAEYNGVLSDDPSNGAEEKKESRPDILIPAATIDLYTEMSKANTALTQNNASLTDSVARLTSLLEKLMQGTATYSGAYAPKNFPTDRK